ncbi:sensor domain-containing protein [Massilia timonae]|uniref:Diguanylate cyclase (GGDEF) domain-containing protein n=1 Tax=Massilia timonae CCUG 45783 TaxID=883126 RepID=K9D815_9BURK|nr:EAL domain-containing protein [Massilia timonae]EKU80804.1 diguanylate cyclase (GGDEF) domain-containing protein [Massilia timonae CCUG 45783]
MSAFDPSEQASFLADDAGTIITWNPQCAALFGLAAADALGRDAAQLLGAPPWPELLEAGAARLALPAGRAASVTLAAQLDASGAARGYSVTVIPATPALSDAERLGATALKDVVDLLPGTFYILDREGRILMWNHNLERVCEMMPEELATANAFDMLDPRDRGEFIDKVHRMFDDNVELEMEVDYVSRSGRETPVLLRGARIDCNGGQYLFGMGIDISKRRARERQLHLYKRALGAASNGVIIAHNGGPDHPTEYVNPAFERITGYAADEIIGRDPRFMAAPGLDGDERNRMRQALHEQRSVHVVLRNLRKNGELFWNDLNITPVHDDNGQVTHFVGILVDVTASKQRADRLEHEVNHDSLTGLANRTLLWDRLDHAVHLAQRHQTLVAAVLIDLDNFKTINDTFGHDAGDAVLKVVARRLQATVRDSDTVARLSGDEFVMVLVDQPSLRYTLRMVERVRRALTMPVAFGGSEIPVGASLGVAAFPHDGRTSADLVRAADMAMYRAKNNGGGVHFYSTEMRSASEARAILAGNMKSALDDDELFLLFQPRMDARSGKVRGFEALLRWRHPEHGVMLPAAFLAEAEESGLIVEIGNRVLDRACAFARELRHAGYTALPVAVNVSHREYSRPTFIAGIAERMSRYGLPPGALEIEIPEADLIRNPGLGRDLAAQLRDVGAMLSIDQFGRGISDLNFLQQLSVRQVKLSKAAVHNIADHGRGGSLAKALIDIGRNLDITVVGEAVETEAQVEFLRSHGCDQMQGQWFSEPLSAEAACRMLAQR